MKKLSSLIRIFAALFSLPCAASALVELDSLSLSIYGPVYTYTLDDDTKIGQLDIRQTNLSLNGHTLEVRDMQITLMGQINGPGTIILTGTATIDAWDGTGVDKLEIRPGAKLAATGRSPVATPEDAILQNDGVLEIKNECAITCDMRGSGAMQLENNAQVTLRGRGIIGRVEGTGSLLVSSDSEGFTYAGPVDRGVEISLRDELHIADGIHYIPWLVVGPYGKLYGSGELTVDKLSIFTGGSYEKHIIGLSTIYVTDSYYLDSSTYLDYYSDATIVPPDNTGLRIVSDQVHKEGNNRWVFNMPAKWENTEAVDVLDFSITSGSPTPIEFRIDVPIRASIRNWTSSQIGYAGGGQSTDHLKLSVGAFIKSYDGYICELTIDPMESGIPSEILEVRGTVYSAPDLNIDVSSLQSDNEHAIAVGSAGVNIHYSIPVSVAQDTGVSLRVHVGGTYGYYHVPEQDLTLTYGQNAALDVYFVCDWGSLPATGLDYGDVEIPMLLDVVVADGAPAIAGYPETLPLKGSYVVYKSVDAGTTGAMINTRMNPGGNLEVFVVPGRTIVTYLSNDMINWRQYDLLFSDVTTIASYDLVSLCNREGSPVFIRMEYEQ